MEKDQEIKIVENTEAKEEINPEWAHECIEDMDDFIESQGVYLRQ